MNENQVINEQENTGVDARTLLTLIGLSFAGYAGGKGLELLWDRFIKPMFNKKVDTDTQVVKVETPEEE